MALVLDLAVHWQFWILDPGPGPKPPKTGPGWPESGPLGPGRAWMFIGRVDDLVLDQQAEVGDHFGHPSGAEVKGLNSEF